MNTKKSEIKRKILYAEDQESTAHLVKYKLEKEGFETIILNDGEHVVQAAIDIQPSLILLDLMLPIKDGLRILKELKNTDKVKNIPVIMLSVQGEEQKILNALNSGAVDYVLKPFSTSELSLRIKKVLA